jgi:hypothetical protein
LTGDIIPSSIDGTTLLPDQVAKASHRDKCRPANLHRFEIASFDKLVELGPAKADHAGSFANADRERGCRVICLCHRSRIVP